MQFPPSFLEEIRNRLPLSQVVGRSVSLKRKGREWAGLSPFNKEKTPSFFVNDEKQFYHCFSSGKSGDVFTWLMESEGMSFPEAVEALAAQAGLQMPMPDPQAARREERRRSLYDAYEAAAEHYAAMLFQPEGEAARGYLERRGLSEDAIRDFRLGYAPRDSAAFITAMKQRGIDSALLLEGELARNPDDGRPPYAFFRDKVIFPVADRRGRIIAFGGRRLERPGQDAAGPKYINSADHPLFHKGETLYAIDKAREAAAKGKPLVVVEGYMDVIALHGAGLTGAVAPLGTALTENQIGALWQMLPEEAADPVLCFDGDRAGRGAAARAVERALPLLRPGRSLRFAFLPEGEDPDSLIAKSGVGAMQVLLDQAIPLSEMLWRVTLGDRPPQTPEQHAGLKKKLMAATEKITDRDIAGLYRRDLNDRLWALRRGDRPRDRRFGPSRQPAAAQYRSVNSIAPIRAPMADASERLLLLILYRHPDLFDEVGEEFAALSFQDRDVAGLHEMMLTILSATEPDARAEALAQAPLSAVADRIARDCAAHLYPFGRPDADLEAARADWEGFQAVLRQRALEKDFVAARETCRMNPGDSHAEARMNALREALDVATEALSLWRDQRSGQ